MDPRIDAAIAGDRDALASLLMEHYDGLSRFIAGQLSNRYRAVVTTEDILQQTFLQATEWIQSFEARTSTAFGSWLRTIACHRLLDAIHRESTAKRGGDVVRIHNEAYNSHGSLVNFLNQLDGHVTTPSLCVGREEQHAALLTHLAQLPDSLREVVTLRYLENLGRVEIAARLNMTEDQVRGALERALKKLRDAMADSSPD